MSEERKSEFWATQPVGKASAPLAKDQETPNTAPKLPMELSDEISLKTVEIDKEMDKLHELLTNHYVEDSRAMFRLEYSRAFLKWQLLSPDSFPDWNVGLYQGEHLIGFISACKLQIQIGGDKPPTAVVNFLCLDRSFRKKRLAPVLIKEITKRVNQKGIYRALFTSGEELPFFCTRAPYYHRIVQADQLVAQGFCSPLDIKPDTASTPTQSRFRQARVEDMPAIHQMYQAKYGQKHLHACLTADQLAYYVQPRPNLVDTLISLDGQEFISIYFIDTKVLSDNSLINTAYIYYYSINDRRQAFDALVAYLKANTSCSVLNALAVEENTPEQLEQEEFLCGDGVLNYYLFNWDTPLISADKNGFIPF
ncbi:glycylpeptide N-tetradecanoyltransferase [Nematocida homosporus]|uniref:glycylpeptide N-tetradecanoyltransferase n=1 Tax=Nematocida homosporus TaxID=1912981 RepID=UPI002220764D|nr:glycylpeptide N-tetradecanoyltransferase [Nematocida homosporus]KAI5185596.1 glycylpeptide N-tetradecanoyltransferase [Nematocida homosporus]